MTLAVTPDDFGPVTVKAVITADGVKMELFASTDAGRDALRSAMTDLRRDLAGTGMNASLDLSSRDAPQQQAGREHQPGQTGPGPRRPAPDTASEPPVQQQPADRRMYNHGPTLDVLA